MRASVRKSFISSAIILIVAGFIARLVGFVYRIYLSNLIGAEGMGLFQLVVPIYTAVVLTITAGISIAVSKMVAEQQARNNTANSGRITSLAIALVIAAGSLVSLFIFFNIDFISTKILGDARTYKALLIMVPCIPAVVAASAFKGYFYGIQKVMPTAFSQVAEQIIKIVFVLFLTGRIAEKGVEFACAVATLSAALGEIANALVLAAVYLFKKRYFSKTGFTGRLMRKRTIIMELLKISVPVSANRMIVSILSAAEYILIPAMLISGGLEYKNSMELFGRLTGMALPLIMFPSLVTNSLATTLVPAISESVSKKNYRAVNSKISKSVQTTLILGMMFTAMLISYPGEIGRLVYRHEDIESLLYMLAFPCIFIYLQQTLTGVLNGLGKQGILLRDTVIGSVIRIAVVYFLMPVYGIRIYVLSLAFSYILTSCLNLFVINKITGLVIDLRGWLLKPGVISVAMMLVGKYIYYFFFMLDLDRTVTILMTLVANALISGFLMMAAGVFKPDEILKMAGLKTHRKIKEM